MLGRLTNLSMEEEVVEMQDSSNPVEDQDSNPEAEVVEEENPELIKAREISENQRIRAEKAERELKALKAKKIKEPEVEEPKSRKQQLLEMRALSDVHEEDVDEVMEYAERKGISIPGAKKSPYILAFLRTREEERATAQATSTTPQRRGARSQPVDYQSKIDNYKLESPEEMAQAAKAFVQSLKGQK